MTVQFKSDAQRDEAGRKLIALQRAKDVYSESEYTKPGDMQTFLQTIKPERDKERYRWSDSGNGLLFADCFKGVCRYCEQKKAWMVYNGQVWEADSEGIDAMRLCWHLGNELMIYATGLPEDGADGVRAKYMKFVQHWQRRKQRETILKDAKMFCKVKAEDFDRSPNLLNCLNGTINLETLEFREHRAEDMLTMMADVNYRKGAVSTLWTQTVHTIMQGNTDNIQFLQRALGYSLLGENERECFFVCYGPSTRNGKDTVLGTVTTMLGDYAIAARPELIAKKYKFDSENCASEAIAQLANKRLVYISELQEGMKMDAGTMKALSGRTKIRARFLYEGSFDFQSECRIFIGTNHRPIISDQTVFKSDRVKVVPFDKHFSEAERDETLKSRLVKPDELSGVLNWCLDGLKAYKERGLEMPPDVQSATNEYQYDSDDVSRFAIEYLEPDNRPEAELNAHKVYERFVDWCVNTEGVNSGMVKSYKIWKESLTHCQLPCEVKRKRPYGSGRNGKLGDIILQIRWKSSGTTD